MSKITKSAKGQTCIKCGHPESFAAHYNGVRQHSFGKGRGIKCDDIASAEFCYKCDQQFKEGSQDERWMNKWERSEEFLFYVTLTNIRRFKEGRLK
ncbi:hypothetical protein KAR91_63505 [Candidatus Pacearchaeota archaeon]|nr:hypothetical protein [Candidatus Pacearchaeota archaeon]